MQLSHKILSFFEMTCFKYLCQGKLKIKLASQIETRFNERLWNMEYLLEIGLYGFLVNL